MRTLGAREIFADPAVRSVVLIVFLVMAGFGLVMPILPLFARSFGVGYAGAGVMISAAAFTRLGADLWAGGFVQRRGERASTSIGLAFVAVCVLATALAPSFLPAVIFWGATGAGTAVIFSALFSHILKVVPPDRMARSLGIFFGAFNIGVIAGGPLGGIVARHFGLTGPLFAYAGVLVVSSFLYARFVPEPPHAKAAPDNPSTRSDARALFRRPGFAVALIANLAYLWAIAAVFDTLVPLFARDALGMSTVGIGIVFSVAVAAELVTMYPAGALADRHGRKPVIVPALAGLTLMTIVVAWSPNAITFGVLMGVLGLASGAAGVTPAAMLSDATPGERPGAAIGMFRVFGDLGFALGPLVAGFAVRAVDFKGAFAIASIPTFLAMLAIWRARETMRTS